MEAKFCYSIFIKNIFIITEECRLAHLIMGPYQPRSATLLVQMHITAPCIPSRWRSVLSCTQMLANEPNPYFIGTLKENLFEGWLDLNKV